MATRKGLSPLKRLLGVLVWVLVVAGSIGLGFWFSHPRPSPPPVAPPAVASVVLMVLGFVAIVIGAALYGLVLATRCLTFSFHKPFFATFKRKLWLAKVVVELFAQSGLALMAAPAVRSGVERLLPPNLAMPVSFFAPFIAAQVLFIWLCEWAPLEVLVIRARLRARGLPDELLKTGLYVGISDPAVSSFRKFTLVEDDIGMLFFNEDWLSYRGDRADWDLKRQQVLEIQRKSDAGSVSSYFGAVHVIVHYRADDRTTRQVRLHPQGDPTMSAKARALDELADRLEAWRAAPIALAADRSSSLASGAVGRP